MPTTITIRERTGPETSLVRRAIEGIRSYTVGKMSLKDPALAKFFGDGYQTAAGIPVTDENIYTFSAVYDAVNQSSSDLAKLPLNLKKRRKEGGSDDFEASKTHWLLKHEANPDMSAFEFRRTLQAHALTCKGAFGEIERNGAGQPTALWPLTPDRVTPCLEKITLPNGRYRSRLRYRIDNDNQHVIEAADMLHIRGLGYDGYCAYPVIDKARQAIGLALAAERFASAFFGNNSNFGGLLTGETDLDPDQREELRAEIEKIHKGPQAAWKLLILGAGFKYQRTGVTPSESQMNDLRAKQVEEVARFFNFPVHKLKNLDRSTNNNIEAENLSYYTGHQLTWITNWEGELNRKLVPSLEIGNQYFKHNANATLRADVAGRTALYTALLDRGVFCADDVLELEDMNPQPNGQGKIFLVQGAMVPKDQIVPQAKARVELIQAQVEKAKQPPPAPIVPVPPVEPGRSRIRLDERWTQVLRDLPESGMGYQRVDVRFRDGRALRAALVFNAEYLDVPDAFSGIEIDDIRLHDAEARVQAAEQLAAEMRASAQQERDTRIAAEATGTATAAELATRRESEQRAIALANNLTALSVQLRAEADEARTHAATAETSRQAFEASAQEQLHLRTIAEAQAVAAEAERVRLASEAATAVERAAAADVAATEARQHAAEQEALAVSATTDRVSAETARQAAQEAAHAASNEATTVRAERDQALADAAAATELAAATRAEADRLAAEAAAHAIDAADQLRAAHSTVGEQATEMVTIRAAHDSVAAALAETQASLEAAEAAAHQRYMDVEGARVDALMRMTTAETALAQEVEQRTAAEVRRADLEQQLVARTAEREAAEAAVEDQRQRAEALEQSVTDARAQLALVTTALADVRGVNETALTALQAGVAALARERDEARTLTASLDTRAAESAALVLAREAELRTVRQADAEAMAGQIAAHRSLLADIMRRMVERETDRARRAQITPDKLQRWLESFYDGHADLMRTALLPAIRVHLAFIRSDEDPIEVTRRVVETHVRDSERQIRNILDGDADAIAASLPALLYRWDQERPTALAEALMKKELDYARRL